MDRDRQDNPVDDALDVTVPDDPSPQHGGRLLAILCLASVLGVVNFAAPSPFFPRIARDLDTTVPLLGQLTTVLTLLSALLGIGVGPLADRYGPRRLIVGGTIAVAINLIGIGVATSYPMLLVLAVIAGVGDAVLFGLPLAVAATAFSGAAQRRAIAWTAASLPVGVTAAVPLLTLAGGLVGWRSAIAGAGVATLGVAALAGAWLPADRSGHGDRFGARMLLDAYRPLLRHRPIGVLYTAGGLRAACWIGMLTYLGAFMTERFDYGARGIGLTYMVSGGAVFLGSLLGARQLTTWRPRPLVALTTSIQALLLGASFTLPLAAPWIIGLLAVAGCTGAVAGIGLTMLLTRETPGGMATTMVLNGSVLNLGTALGAAAGGLLVARGGYTALGVGLPLFALIAALLIWGVDSTMSRDPAV